MKQLIRHIQVTSMHTDITRFSNSWDFYLKLKGKISIKFAGFYAPVAEVGPDLLG